MHIHARKSNAIRMILCAKDEREKERKRKGIGDWWANRLLALPMFGVLSSVWSEIKLTRIIWSIELGEECSKHTASD